MQNNYFFNTALALRYGLVEAIILQALATWIEKAEKEDYCYTSKGMQWIQLTLSQLRAELAFLSPYRIRTALDNLEAALLIQTEEIEPSLGVRKRSYVVYAVTDKGRQLLQGGD